jgi:hypothetical protein
VRRRYFVIITTIVLLGLIAGFATAAVFRSNNFREWMSHKVSRSLGADGYFEPITWSGTSFHSAGFHAAGGPKSKLINLHATNISAHLRWPDLFLGRCVIDHLSVDHLDVALGKKPKIAAVPTRAKTEGFHWPSLNIDFRISELSVKQVDLHWSKDERVQGTLSGSQATALQNRNGGWTFNVTGGELSQAAFLPITLVMADGTANAQTINVREAKFQASQGGTIRLHGSIEIRNQLFAKLQADFADLDLSSISPRIIQEQGFATGTANYSGNLDRFEDGEGSGEILLTKVKLDLSGLFGKFRPFLKAGGLADVPLDQVGAKLKYSDHGLTISDLHANQGDEIRINGSGTIQRNQLDGDLQVGVSSHILDPIPGVSEKVFSEKRDGLRWTPVKLSGTIRQPREDLSQRLVAAIESQLSNELKNQAKEAAKSLLDRLLH